MTREIEVHAEGDSSLEFMNQDDELLHGWNGKDERYSNWEAKEVAGLANVDATMLVKEDSKIEGRVRRPTS